MFTITTTKCVFISTCTHNVAVIRSIAHAKASVIM